MFSSTVLWCLIGYMVISAVMFLVISKGFQSNLPVHWFILFLLSICWIVTLPLTVVSMAVEGKTKHEKDEERKLVERIRREVLAKEGEEGSCSTKQSGQETQGKGR
jgi:uncharacterized membrane protein